MAYLTFPDDSMLINTNTGLILQSGLVTLLSSKNENACQNNVSNRFSTAFPIRYLASQSLRTALESPRQNEAVIANATLTDFSQGSGPKAYLIGTSIDRIEPSYQGKAIGLEKAIRFLRHYKPTSKNVAEVHKSQHQFKEERQDWLDEKSRRVSNWDNRYDLEYSEGDRVCTYDNRFGRIISQSDQHVRVRVQGVVNSEPDGVFFTMPYRTFIHSRGRFGNYTNEQFRYRRLNRVAWWDLGSFSRCSMSDVNEPG